jgi:hypothetical protein
MRLVRIPLLIVLLLVSGPLQWRYAQQRFVFTQDGMVGSIPPWLLLVAVAVTFLVVAGAGRGQRHAGWILVLEGFVATVVALVPPLVWAQVAGAGPWTEAMGGTTGAAYAQVLGVVWLVTVVRTGLSQRRARRAGLPA